MRSGGGPILLEAVTERVRGHYEGDPQRYRDPAAVTADDPLERSRTALINAGVDLASLKEVEATVEAEIHRAIEAARRAPSPNVERMHEIGDVRSIVGRATISTATEEEVAAEPIRGSKAVRTALDDALADDPRVFLAGIDVAGGNVFGLTRGLADKHPGRLLDTPISETAIMGLAVGAAMDGLRPVVELMYLDFLGVRPGHRRHQP
ncbi:thiamine pyrophosphate-dependent enzyme [Actinomadura viridis]|uniref:thiamine pyrophosphate-dependent enzyme n=1 Tax=Actinomadura viridis TaxID=58110 RepID=UPI0036AE4A91